MTLEERKEAIEYLKKYKELDKQLFQIAPFNSVSHNVLVKCLRHWDTAIQALERNPQEPKWIPVSERLPKKDESVLLTICANSSLYGFNENFVKVMCGSYSPCEDERDWIVNEVRYYIGNVIAWMPLPTPYDPQERSEE